MTDERLRDARQLFSAALVRLEDALARPQDEYLRDSVIQRFEFCFELAWKAMKLWLAARQLDVRNPRDALKEAHTQGLIGDGHRWSELHRYRNLTVHTYRLETAVEVHAFIRDHAPALFRELRAALERTP